MLVSATSAEKKAEFSEFLDWTLFDAYIELLNLDTVWNLTTFGTRSYFVFCGDRGGDLLEMDEITIMGSVLQIQVDFS